MVIPATKLGSVVPGATLLDKADRGVNETFIGSVDIAAGRVRAYIKVIFGHQLVNELVAATLGRTVGFAIPEGYLVRARPSDLPESVALAAHAKEALIFASREISAPDLKRRMKVDGAAAIAELFAAWVDWAPCMTFDEWVVNPDRHSGNVLFGGPGEIWLIDHGHCFTGPNWKASDLVPNGMWGNQIALSKIPGLTLPERLAAQRRVADQIQAIKPLDCPGALAASGASTLLAPDDASALQTFVGSRVSYLYDILSSRLGIPSIFGATR